MIFRTVPFTMMIKNNRLKADFNKAIHIDLWITRPGAYAYKIDYDTLPPWDPFNEMPDRAETKKVRHLQYLY